MSSQRPFDAIRTRGIRSVLTLSLLFAGAACTHDAATSPASRISSEASRFDGALDRLYTVQLRGIPNDPTLPPNPIYGHGQLTIRSGATLGDACLPPNPVTPAPGSTLLTICGKIFNDGGALYRGGAIWTVPSGLGDGAIFIASFGGTQPGDPYRRYDLAGAITVSDAVAADMMADPSGYQVIMNGDVAGTTVSIGGLFDGSAWGPVGSRPETDPFYTARSIALTITP